MTLTTTYKVIRTVYKIERVRHFLVHMQDHDFRAEKERSLVAFVAGITNTFISFTTSDRRECDWDKSVRNSRIEENRTGLDVLEKLV